MLHLEVHYLKVCCHVIASKRSCFLPHTTTTTVIIIVIMIITIVNINFGKVEPVTKKKEIFQNSKFQKI